MVLVLMKLKHLIMFMEFGAPIMDIQNRAEKENFTSGTKGSINVKSIPQLAEQVRENRKTNFKSMKEKFMFQV